MIKLTTLVLILFITVNFVYANEPEIVDEEEDTNPHL